MSTPHSPTANAPSIVRAIGHARIIVVGTSWGGLSALSQIVNGLPADFRLPIVIVQHRGRDSGDTMASVLQSRSKRPVREVEDKDPIEPGHVYVAPPDYHLLIDEGYLALSIDEPIAFSRPSIDVLFESAADAYGQGVVGVLLTGANQDGTRGLARIKSVGGYTIVQDPASAEVNVMPASAIADGPVDRIAALGDIAPALVVLGHASSLANGGQGAALPAPRVAVGSRSSR